MSLTISAVFTAIKDGHIVYGIHVDHDHDIIQKHKSDGPP